MSPETSGDLWFALYSLLAAVATAALAVGAMWLHSRAKTSRWLLLMEQLWAVAQAVVADVEAKIRPTLKSALADGKLDASDRAKIQAEAIRLFKDAIGTHGLEQLKKSMGGGNVEVFLAGLLERALKAFKAPVVTAPVVQTPPTVMLGRTPATVPTVRP
jgi:hypothetical protein